MRHELTMNFLFEQKIIIEVDPNEKTGYKIMHYSQDRNVKDMS